MIDPESLKRQVLLEDIGSEELKKLAGIIRQMSFKKGEHLFRERDETRGLYLIHSGKVEISKVTPDGWRQTMAVLPSGHFFGELSILERRQHEASAVALEDTELFLIAKEDFENLMKEDIALACYIIKKIAIVMSKNLRRMNERFLGALISY
jgi:CRP/FNR family transcriptional regulator